MSNLKRDLEQRKYKATFDGPDPSLLPAADLIRQGLENIGDRKVVPCNADIVEIMDILKTEVVDLIDMLTTLRCWISLAKPKLEDGNNFVSDYRIFLFFKLGTHIFE